MFRYVLRRVLYAVPIIFGVMFVSFVLFFIVVTPRARAMKNLGPKARPEAIAEWLHNRGYDKPRFFNTGAGKNPLDSQFFGHVASLARFDFGYSDSDGEPVIRKFSRGAIPSLLITVPSMIAALILEIALALFFVFVRDSKVDRGGIVLSVILMSIIYAVYVIFFQWLVAVKCAWLPAFGFDASGWTTLRFLVLPVVIMVIAGLGGGVRMYRTIFLEEIHQDYIRTAQAKGASDVRVLFTHVLKNGMISVITLVVASIPLLVMGSMITENFFGIPGLGNLMLTAIRTGDTPVVLASVYLGALLYLLGLLLTDICYAAADPRIRLR